MIVFYYFYDAIIMHHAFSIIIYVRKKVCSKGRWSFKKCSAKQQVDQNAWLPFVSFFK